MTKTFWLKIKKFTHRIPTKMKTKFCRKINCRRCSSEGLECSFENKIGKTFAIKWKEIRTKSAAMYEIFIFSKDSYPLKDPLDTYSAFLTTSLKCLSCFPQRSASKYLIIKFRGRKFFTIMFSVYIYLICDSIAEKCLLKNWKRSSCFKFLKINSVFLKDCSSGDSKYKIDHQAGNSAQSPKRSRSNTEKKNRRGFFQKMYFA